MGLEGFETRTLLHLNHDDDGDTAPFPETEDIWSQMGHHHHHHQQGHDLTKSKRKMKKNKKQVLLEGYVVEPTSEDDLTRTKSLTDEDLDELKGCLDLGFGFSYDEIPELCNTLPALELCYSMSQRFLDDHHHHHRAPEMGLSDPPVAAPAVGAGAGNSASPIANWKISSPGDHPDDVKARLKFWAQAVACTVKLCS